MFSHRNLSILTFEKGSTPQETNSTSQGPGFVEYLKQCATELPGVAPDDPALLEAILQDYETFQIPGRQEALDLSQACIYAREFYSKPQLGLDTCDRRIAFGEALPYTLNLKRT